MWFKPSCDFQSLPKQALVKAVLKTQIKPHYSQWVIHSIIPVSERECAPQIPAAELDMSTLALISLLKPRNCWMEVVQCYLYQRNMCHKLLPLALGRWWCLCSQGPACYWSLLYKENMDCRFHSLIISYSFNHMANRGWISWSKSWFPAALA